MKFLICISLLMLGTVSVQAKRNLTAVMVKSEIISDVVSEPATQVLKVIFDSGVRANLGNELTPTQTKDEPFLDWNVDFCAYYTLIFTDPDAPNPRNHSMRELSKWIVINIQGNDVGSGEVLVEYNGPAPPIDGGKHRFVFLLFRQPGLIDFDGELIDRYTFEGRPGFSTRKFAQKYNLGAPVAVNYLMAQYDDYVPILYAQLGQ